MKTNTKKISKSKPDLIDANKLVKPSTYAATRKPPVTPQNVYSLISRGKLQAKTIDNTIFVVLK